VSNLVKKFDELLNGEMSLEHAIIDTIESRSVDVPEIRKVSDEAIFQVAERIITASADVEDKGVVYFNALREINNFLTLAYEGPTSNGMVKHTDLLPIHNPSSTITSAVLTASAIREQRAEWIAADPRITNENVRGIIASVYSSNPMSVEFTYHLTQLQMLPPGQVPSDLLIRPLVAFGDPYAGKNSFWHRKQRAEGQRRDRFGQFAEMGGGGRIYVKMKSGQIMSVVCKVAGNGTDPNSIDVEITDVKGIKNGIYSVPLSVFESIKAILPEHAVKNYHQVGRLEQVPFVDIKDMKRRELPTSWYSSRVGPRLAQLTNKPAAARHFVTSDGYQATKFDNHDETTLARIAEAQRKFGATVVGPDGTDVLDPKKPIFELVSSKRGQEEVVGYAQEWSAIQKLASSEDATYPGVENEPVDNTGKVAPAQVAKPVPLLKKAVSDLTPEQVDSLPASDEGYSPDENMPGGWHKISDGWYGSNNYRYTAHFGNWIVGETNDPSYDDRFDEQSVSTPIIARDTISAFDALSGLPVGTAFNWEDLQDSIDLVERYSPIIKRSQGEAYKTSGEFDVPLDDEALELIKPEDGVSYDKDQARWGEKWEEPIEKKIVTEDGLESINPDYQHIQRWFLGYNKETGMGRGLYHTKQLPPEYFDMLDHMLTYSEKYTPKDFTAIYRRIKALPDRPTPAAWSKDSWYMPDERNKIRLAIARKRGLTNLTEEQYQLIDDIQSRYRSWDAYPTMYALKKELLSLNALERNADYNPEKGLREDGQDQQQDQGGDDEDIPITPQTMKKLETAATYRKLTPRLAERIDDMYLSFTKNENRFSNAQAMDLISELNQQRKLNPQEGDQPNGQIKVRQYLRAMLGWYDVPDAEVQRLLETMHDMNNEELKDEQSRIKGGYPARQNAEGFTPKLAAEVKEEQGQAVEPDYLFSNVGDKGPSKPMMIKVEALFENGDFSDKEIQDFIDVSPDKPYMWWKNKIAEFSKRGFNDKYKPAILTTNLTENAPSLRQLQSLEILRKKGLISDDLWEDLLKTVPNMTKWEIQRTLFDGPTEDYPDALGLKVTEADYDAAILRDSIEFGLDITDLRVPNGFTVPEDYTPKYPGIYREGAKTVTQYQDEIAQERANRPDVPEVNLGGTDDIAEKPEEVVEEPVVEEPVVEEPTTEEPTTEEPAQEETPVTEEAPVAEEVIVEPGIMEDEELANAARLADARRLRNNVRQIIAAITQGLDLPRKEMPDDARKVMKKAFADLNGLVYVMHGNRLKNAPTPNEVNRLLTLVSDGVAGIGEGAYDYGDTSNLTPEQKEYLNRISSSIDDLIGSYKAGIFKPRSMAAENSRITPILKKAKSEIKKAPRMKFFYPPAFHGAALEPLRGMKTWDEVIEFLSNHDIYVFDFETTGIPDLDDPAIKNDPIQMAVLRARKLSLDDIASTYINPESDISHWTLKEVGDGKGGKVTYDFLSQQPTKRQAMEQFLQFVPKGAILLGHNGLLFDLEVLNRTLRESGLPEYEIGGFIDTLGLSKHIMPEWSQENPDAPYKIVDQPWNGIFGVQKPSNTLESLVTYFGLSNNGRHEADADIVSTLEVFQAMLDRAKRGLSAGGRDFNFDATTNGYTDEDYDTAKEVYKAEVTHFLADRLALLDNIGADLENSQARSILEQLLGNFGSVVQEMLQGGQIEDNSRIVDTPAANIVNDLPSGSYVMDVVSGRIGQSRGAVESSYVLVEFPGTLGLVDGSTIIEPMKPSNLANVTDQYTTKDGVLVDYDMAVSHPSIPSGVQAGVSGFVQGGCVTVNVPGGQPLTLSIADILITGRANHKDSSEEQNNQILNLVDDLAEIGLLSKSQVRGYQKAVNGGFYSERTAGNVISRLGIAKQQSLSVQANEKDGVETPLAERAAVKPIIKKMSSERPADTITVKDLKKALKELETVIDQLKVQPTAEGKNNLAAILGGYNVVIQALAGTGKTTNLEQAARVLKMLRPKLNIIYSVFNKQNELEAKARFGMESDDPTRTNTMTHNSMAFNTSVNKTLAIRMKAQEHGYSVNGKYSHLVATLFGFDDYVSKTPIGWRVAPTKKKGKKEDESAANKITKDQIAEYAYDALEEWMKSADPSITPKHFTRFNYAVEEGTPVPAVLLEAAEQLWAAYVDEDYDSGLRVTHDVMFKNWALTDPDMQEVNRNGISVHGFKNVPDVIFLDEAQDVNPVFLDLLIKQHELHNNNLQIVTVGDTNQGIYGFRGATNGLEVIPRDITLSLTQSFRTGSGALGPANNVLRLLGEELRLVGRPDLESIIIPTGDLEIGKPGVDGKPIESILAVSRTNMGIIAEALKLKIAFPNEEDKKLFGTTKAFKKHALDMLEWLIYFRLGPVDKDGKIRSKPKSAVPDELAGPESWDDVQKALESGTAPHGIKLLLSLAGKLVKAYNVQAEFDEEGNQKRLSTTGALIELKEMVKNFRLHVDGYAVPKEVGKSGDLGNNIGYKIIGENKNNKKIRVFDVSMSNDFGVGVYENRAILEELGFKRTEELNDKGKPKYWWEKRMKDDGKKQLEELVHNLSGKNIHVLGMTGHTAKGLERDYVRLGEDWYNLDSKKAWDALEELRLVYVALTRPKLGLALGNLEGFIEDPKLEIGMRKDSGTDDGSGSPIIKKAISEGTPLDKNVSGMPKEFYEREIKKLEEKMARIESGEELPGYYSMRTQFLSPRDDAEREGWLENPNYDENRDVLIVAPEASSRMSVWRAVDQIKKEIQDNKNRMDAATWNYDGGLPAFEASIAAAEQKIADEKEAKHQAWLADREANGYVGAPREIHEQSIAWRMEELQQIIDQTGPWKPPGLRGEGEDPSQFPVGSQKWMDAIRSNESNARMDDYTKSDYKQRLMVARRKLEKEIADLEVKRDAATWSLTDLDPKTDEVKKSPIMKKAVSESYTEETPRDYEAHIRALIRNQESNIDTLKSYMKTPQKDRFFPFRYASDDDINESIKSSEERIQFLKDNPDYYKKQDESNRRSLMELIAMLESGSGSLASLTDEDAMRLRDYVRQTMLKTSNLDVAPLRSAKEALKELDRRLDGIA